MGLFYCVIYSKVSDNYCGITCTFWRPQTLHKTGLYTEKNSSTDTHAHTADTYAETENDTWGFSFVYPLSFSLSSVGGELYI